MTQEEIKTKALEIIEGRLEKANNLTDRDLFSMNLTLPPQYKYQTIREVQVVMVKGAFDALGFTVELGLLDNQAAADYWKELHRRYSKLWPENAL
jgi:uncharacterized protein YlaN (UPF0358 family)